MKSLLLTLLLVTLTPLAHAAELDKAAAAMNGSEAQFVHRFTPKGFKSAQVESGTVTFGTLPMMRWSYAKPEQKLFIFDGTKSWFYVPADRQVTVSQLDDAKRRELPFLVLGDPAARDRSFVVRESASRGAIVTNLAPRAAGAAIRSVAVTTDAATHQIRRVDYTDRDGNQTSFEFSGYHRSPATAELFRFAPPAGVQVVNAD